MRLRLQAAGQKVGRQTGGRIFPLPDYLSFVACGLMDCCGIKSVTDSAFFTKILYFAELKL